MTQLFINAFVEEVIENTSKLPLIIFLLDNFNIEFCSDTESTLPK